MKTNLALLFLLLSFACNNTDNTRNKASNETGISLNRLTIFDETYPRAFFFRPAEKTYEPYEMWEQEFSRLMGIEGKVLEEELMGISDPNIAYFTRFKRNNPEQLVIMHYNGNARHPNDNTEEFFAGHWLYFVGAKVSSDIKADEDTSVIRVEDVSLFKTNIGRFDDQNEDIGICELDDSGKPNWHESEQVKLISVDKKNNTITVKRGMYGTSPKAFSGGKTYAASHVTEGPWGQDNQILWAYNFTTNSPKDKNGENCGDVLAKELAQRFSSEGELAAFDGLEFDVLHNDLNPLYGGWGVLKEGDRFPDSNADGLADEGFFEGKNLYGIGVVEFCQKLRNLMGDNKLILADGTNERAQRAFGILNGIESEGWPMGNDYEINHWSGGLNRLNFWKENSKKPDLTYVNHRWWKKTGKELYTPFSRQRMVVAASVLTGTAHSVFVAPPKTNNQITIWDELNKGTENQVGWLGKPLGAAVRMAQNQPELTNYQPADYLQKFQEVNPDKEVSLEDNMLKIAQRDVVEKDIAINLPSITINDENLLLLMTLKCDKINGYPKEWARLATLKMKNKAVPEEAMAYLNTVPFESAFYFTGVKNESVDAQLVVDSSEPVYIENIKAYAHPDIMYRKFENGLVIANPSTKSFQVNMKELFSANSYRRLRGSSNQDPEFNNGESIGDTLVLAAKDAIFLVKE